MTQDRPFEIFLATFPGLEPILLQEARLKGFKLARAVPGGVTIRGFWPEVWRANLWLRGANRILARLDAFPSPNLAALDSRARRTDWAATLRPDIPFRVQAHCAGSRIYHSGAAEERIARAITATLGAPASPEAEIAIHARIEDDHCTISVDTSGTLLHKRGYKSAVNAAPMRETMAALFLLQCGFDGREPLLDPMCGSGTFVIEAAEISAGLNPGRARAFAFEHLATFEAEAWARLRSVTRARPEAAPCLGFDRDAGAVAMSRANAERAGIAARCRFDQAPIAALRRPEGPPGLVIINPPYGARLGEATGLAPLYRALGQSLRGFTGWRIGLVASEHALAHATGLPFLPNGPPVPHGGLRVTLFQTAPLAPP